MVYILESLIFWQILGLGVAIPTTIITVITLLTQVTAKGQYQADLGKWFKIYMLALLGWAVFFGVR